MLARPCGCIAWETSLLAAIESGGCVPLRSSGTATRLPVSSQNSTQMKLGFRLLCIRASHALSSTGTLVRAAVPGEVVTQETRVEVEVGGLAILQAVQAKVGLIRRAIVETDARLAVT
jgi:hypothetical protein